MIGIDWDEYSKAKGSHQRNDWLTGVIYAMIFSNAYNNEKEKNTMEEKITNEAKDTKGKTRLELVLPSTIEWLGRIRTYGVQKYKDPDNWKKVPKDQYVGAAMRHFEKYRKGEYLDDESGMPHLAHAMCNLMFLLDMEDDERTVQPIRLHNHLCEHCTHYRPNNTCPIPLAERFNHSFPSINEAFNCVHFEPSESIDIPKVELYHDDEAYSKPMKAEFKEADKEKISVSRCATCYNLRNCMINEAFNPSEAKNCERYKPIFKALDDAINEANKNQEEDVKPAFDISDPYYEKHVQNEIDCVRTDGVLVDTAVMVAIVKACNDIILRLCETGKVEEGMREYLKYARKIYLEFGIITDSDIIIDVSTQKAIDECAIIMKLCESHNGCKDEK